MCLVGVLGGIAIAGLRLVALAAMLAGPSPFPSGFAAQLIVELALIALFTFNLYRGKPWGAIALTVLWGIGYFYAWALSGRGLPPLVLIGILIWYALYRGIRGTRALASASKAPAPAV